MLKAAVASNLKWRQVNDVIVDIKISDRVVAIARIKDDLIGTRAKC